MALFQFGRTLACTCGERVGRELRRALGAEAEPRFAADAMLGRLARWLRVLGYDTSWEAHVPDGELVARAVREGRTLLTRDRRLPEEWWIDAVVVLEANAPFAQLRELSARVPIDPERTLFTRCTLCNVPLDSAGRDEVRERVPERVTRQQVRFARCRQCGRVYWEGSHTARMRMLLRSALGGPQAGAAGDLEDERPRG